jgi:hypothetical protein
VHDTVCLWLTCTAVWLAFSVVLLGQMIHVAATALLFKHGVQQLSDLLPHANPDIRFALVTQHGRQNG